MVFSEIHAAQILSSKQLTLIRVLTSVLFCYQCVEGSLYKTVVINSPWSPPTSHQSSSFISPWIQLLCYSIEIHQRKDKIYFQGTKLAMSVFQWIVYLWWDCTHIKVKEIIASNNDFLSCHAPQLPTKLNQSHNKDKKWKELFPNMC